MCVCVCVCVCVCLGQVILSVMWAGGFLGLSYYEVESAYLFFMPSIAETHDFELFNRGLACNWLIFVSQRHVLILPVGVFLQSCTRLNQQLY